MTARYAIYFAPALDSPLWRRAMEWFDQPDLQTLTVSARRYGFHATIKAPMHLARPYGELAEGLAGFARVHAPAALTGLLPRLIGGFLALTCAPQPEAVTDLAAEVVEAFEPFRLPPSASEIARRLKAPLTARQVELVERYGYP